MFTTAHPRVATPRGDSAGRNIIRGRATRVGAAVTAVALGGAFALAAPLSASADDERPTSYAEGQFLSGMILGTDLARVAEVESAEARNDGSQDTQTTKDPFDASVLQTVDVGADPAPQVDLGDVLQLGPVGQYASAKPDGSSIGASGAVVNDGVIGVGDDTSAPPADATFDLEGLLGPEFASTITDLKLELGSIAARAEGDLDQAAGSYQLAGAELTFTSPALADLTPKVDTALQQVNDSLNQLVGDNGALVGEVNGLLVNLDPALNVLGGGGDVSATIDTGNIEDAVHAVLADSYGDGAVSFDLETGVVHVDLEKLAGGNLNGLAPNTELLTDEVVDQILDGITSTVSTVADQVVEKVEDTLHDAKVTIDADLSTDVAQAPIVQQVCQVVDEVLTTPVLGDASLIDQLNALTNGLVGNLTDDVLGDVGDLVYDQDGVIKEITGFVNQTVQKTVCSDQSTPVAPLTTGVTLDIAATVDQLLSGLATTADADVEVLGASVPVNVDLLLGDLGSSLLDGLFDGDGGVQRLIDALNTTLVHPATDALLGSGDGTVGDALRDLLSVKVNVQEVTPSAERGMAVTAGQMFTETAVRVSVANGQLATVNLAQATVGPNVDTVVTCPAGTSCVPGGPGGPGTPGGSGGSGAPGGPSSLAYTGIGIGLLVAVVLALLAAGAYLVRESYRRNHAGVPTLD